MQVIGILLQALRAIALDEEETAPVEVLAVIEAARKASEESSEVTRVRCLMTLLSTGTDQRFGLLTWSVARAGRLYVPSVSYNDKQIWETTCYHPHQAVEAIGMFLDGIEVVDEPAHN